MRFEVMNKKRPRRSRKMPSGQGFYLVLLICLGIIGATTFFALNSGPQSVNPAATPGNGAEAQYIPGGGLEEQVKTPTNQPASPSGTMPQSPAATPAATPKPTAVKLTVPVKGDIVVDYHMDKLVYSKTLKDWTTHKGIDIAAKTGTTVKAALSGVVEKAGKDAQMGYMVVLSHGGGSKTVYANLDKIADVKAGQSVKAGDAVGTVGASAIAESEELPHLHFEYIVGGKHVDPKKYVTGLKTVEPTP